MVGLDHTIGQKEKEYIDSLPEVLLFAHYCTFKDGMHTWYVYFNTCLERLLMLKKVW